MIKIRFIAGFLLLFSLSAVSKDRCFPLINLQMGNAFVRTENSILTVNTGIAERRWELTNTGLKTLSVRDLTTNKIFSNDKDLLQCDWSYYGLIDDNSNGKLLSLDAHIGNDGGYTSEHIEITAEFEYPEISSSVRYVIWAYPGAPGFRTQLFIKGDTTKFKIPALPEQDKGIDFIPVKGQPNNSYKATAFADLHIASVLQDSESVELHIKRLNHERKYKLGFTWWDYDGGGTEQNVWVSSTDGEIRHQLLGNSKLPDFVNDKASFEQLIFDIPSSVLKDGSFRLEFEKVKGARAVVSEVFLYEYGNRQNPVRSINEKRVNGLIASSPDSTILAGYFDCGNPVTVAKSIPTGRVDRIPIKTNGLKRGFVGYYNDTQHRNKPETPLLQEFISEKKKGREQNNWSSIVALSKKGQGILMLKESHKCVNQYGVDTGDFLITEYGVENRGTSLFPKDLKKDEFSWCWASWTVVFSGGEDRIELALKEFDRYRYPVDPKRDIYIQANSWGSGGGQEASRENVILREIQSQKDLGIDFQQIDDGWQNERAHLPAVNGASQISKNERDWQLRRDWYPEGWKNVVAASNEAGVKLGLWAAAMPVTLNALKWHYDNGGFVTYKLDFADLSSHDKMEELIHKIRTFIDYTGNKVRVNWDLTENAPRYGYYWAREYGCIYLENRKPDKPANAIYVPSLVLRDIWHLSKYTNTNKFQTSIQNIERVDKTLSDAYLHNHPYSVAIGLVGTPLFFQETSYYSEEAKSQIRPLLAKYKEHRQNLYASYVFPIGDEPDNASWTGFQWYNPAQESGYLMILRELNNADIQKVMKLRFLSNQKVEMNDLMTGENSVITIDKLGNTTFQSITPAGFRFYQYKILK